MTPEQQNVPPCTWHAESIRLDGAPFLMLVMNEWPQVIQPAGDPRTAGPGEAPPLAVFGDEVTAEIYPHRPAEGDQQ